MLLNVIYTNSRQQNKEATKVTSLFNQLYM